MMSRVIRVTMCVADVAVSSSFYNLALGLRRVSPAVVSGASFDILGGDMGAGAALALRLNSSSISAAAAAAAAKEEEKKKVSYPFLTFAVSNLRTSSRHAIRMGGSVVIPGTVESTFVDPSGQMLRAVHRFRRAPIVSLTIGVADLQLASNFFVSSLGGRILINEDQISEALLRKKTNTNDNMGGGEGIAIAWGEEHNTTLLVLEQRSHSGDGDNENGAASDPVLTIMVNNIAKAREAFLKANLPIIDNTTAQTGDGFIAICHDGYAFNIVSSDSSTTGAA